MKNSLFFIPLLLTFLSLQHAHAQKDSVLLKVYFSEGKFVLSPAAKRTLKGFVAQYKDTLHVNIAGRGDRHGSDALNDSLSLKRALAVKNYLIANGFPRANIHALIGYGRRNPIKNGPAYVDADNRVVWITVVKDEAPILPKTNVLIYRDSLVLVNAPFPSQFLVRHPSPKSGDTLLVETRSQQVGDTLRQTRVLYLAGRDGSHTKPEPPNISNKDTARVVLGTGVKEIPEKTKSSAIAQAFMDSLQNSTAGQSIIIRRLSFEFGYHLMPTTNLPALAAVSAALKTLPTLKLEIRGHVCCGDLGQDVFDKQTGQYDLSYHRAREVYDFLVANGADQTRISYAGYGMKQPMVYPEKSKNDQYRNRRIEFVILSK